jgi:DNA-binding NtrC family response regulator
MPLKIYYLDDEPFLLEAFQDTFADEHFEVHVFPTVKEFFEAVAKAKPDIVVLDFRIHDTNGDEVAKKLPLEIPKIMITGDLQVKLECKFEAVFEKPWKEIPMKEFLAKFKEKKAA